MGSNGSKNNNDTSVVSAKNGNIDYENSNCTDPRSPTPEIVRTPLQNKPGAKHNITKNVDLRKTFENGNSEEKLIHNNPILSAVIKNHLQSYDPRSPTQEFVRTPIVISNKDNESTEIQDEDCDSPQLKDEKCDSCNEATETSPELVVPKNLCNGFFDLSLNDTLKETEEPLGSSTASNEAIENNITQDSQKPTQLLETNFDYVEPEDGQVNDVPETVNEIKNIPLFKILDTDPRSPSIGIERTPIVVAKTEDDSEDNVEEMSDDSLIKVLQNTNAELRQAVNTQTQNPEGLLIYEDNTPTINDTPKKSKSISNSGSRTPLSCMKNKDANHTRSKSLNTVNDPKDQKVSKIPKRVSHIPRLKSLSKQTKLLPTGSSVSLRNISKATNGDCENTPPHSHRDRWDKDSSIVL